MHKKIAIIGAGFGGLSAAYYLIQKGFAVEVFEKEEKPGGLAIGVQIANFSWPIEKHYHHLFTNDTAIINLIHELGLSSSLLFPKPLTSLYYQGKIYPFNSPSHILGFSPLSLIDRLRLSFVSAYLKIIPKSIGTTLERETALSWIHRTYGARVSEVVWDPLINGKFGPYKNVVNMAWFWARIKKRTFTLGYIKGGFQFLAEQLGKSIVKSGGVIHYNTSFDQKNLSRYDKVVVTTPTSIFLKLFPQLSQTYTKQLNAISHLHALNLLLVMDETFFEDHTYWLNVNDRSFPFIAVVEHTNFIDPVHYNGKRLLYIGNYLPKDHPYLSLSKEELLKKFVPFLKKINPRFRPSSIVSSELFFGPFAQPVFPVNYSRHIPEFETPIKNVFLANMDMVYPWDRGTNYAVEIGKNIAESISHQT